MNNWPFVEIVNCTQQLLHERRHVLFSDCWLVFGILQQVSTTTYLCHDIVVLTIIIHFMKFQYIRMVQRSEDHQFWKEILFDLNNFGFRDDLDSPLFPCGFWFCNKDTPKGSLSKPLQKNIFFIDIGDKHPDETLSFDSVSLDFYVADRLRIFYWLFLCFTNLFFFFFCSLILFRWFYQVLNLVFVEFLGFEVATECKWWLSTECLVSDVRFHHSTNNSILNISAVHAADAWIECSQVGSCLNNCWLVDGSVSYLGTFIEEGMRVDSAVGSVPDFCIAGRIYLVSFVDVTDRRDMRHP